MERTKKHPLIIAIVILIVILIVITFVIIINYSETTNISGARFDGVDDYILIDNNSALNFNGQTKSMSISFWASANETAYGIILDNEDNYYILFDEQGFFLYDQSDWGNLYHNVWILNMSKGIQNHTWYHYVITYDGTGEHGVRMYVNGSRRLVTSFSYHGGWTDGGWTYKGWTDTGENFAIGVSAKDLKDWPFNGSIDEIRIYNWSIPQSLVSEIYKSGREKNQSLSEGGLILWMPLNEKDLTNK